MIPMGFYSIKLWFSVFAYFSNFGAAVCPVVLLLWKIKEELIFSVFSAFYLLAQSDNFPALYMPD